MNVINYRLSKKRAKKLHEPRTQAIRDGLICVVDEFGNQVSDKNEEATESARQGRVFYEVTASNGAKILYRDSSIECL